jgi:hypothetical protein
LIQALITGDNATLNALGAEYQKAGEVAAELLGKLGDYLGQIDDYTFGRIVGRIIGETLVLVLTEGAGEIAQLRNRKGVISHLPPKRTRS